MILAIFFSKNLFSAGILQLYNRRYYSQGLIQLGKIGPSEKSLAVKEKTGELCCSDGGDFAIGSVFDALDLVRNIKASKAFRPDTKTFYDFMGKPIKAPLTSGFNLLYRGQEQNWPLVPGIFRSVPKTINRQKYLGYYDETSGFQEFYSKLLSSSEKNELTIFQHLAIMQHYGLPTRLMDWTKKFTVGLHFALRNVALMNVSNKSCKFCERENGCGETIRDENEETIRMLISIY